MNSQFGLETSAQASVGQQHYTFVITTSDSSFLLLPLSDAPGVPPSTGGAGRLLERADWWMSEGADLPPPPRGWTQSAEAVWLSPQR